MPSGLSVTLEECINCGVSGRAGKTMDSGHRTGMASSFVSSPPQTIVIQTREDGVSIDQVVLPSEKYLTTRPGAA
jgi:hypothetical protein